MSDCDVLVIGSGVAGALIAWKLASSGASVLILEAGQPPGDRSTLLNSYAASKSKTPNSPYKGFESKYAPSPELTDDYYVQPAVEKFQSTYERIVGGSTWHMLGHTPRLIPSDFELASRTGRGVDWPISYTELEPWYTLAEKALGVAGEYDEWNGVQGAWRSTIFPMPEVVASYSDNRVAAAISGTTILDKTIKVLSTPSARNTVIYDGRPACQGNASCVPLCPIQAKYDATIHVTKAQKLGARLETRSVVTRLLADFSGSISGVEYKTWDGEKHLVTARIVVLAANAIESAKILLLSRVGIQSDQVGRNLMDHLTKSSFGKSREPLYPFRGPPSTSGIEVFRNGPERKERAAFRISLNNDGWFRRNSPIAEIQDIVDTQALFGSELIESLRLVTRSQLRLSCSTEVLPRAWNRITLSTELDALGIPRPQLAFRADSYTKAALGAANDVMRAIFAAVGDKSPIIDGDLNHYSGAGHIMGTCRMGKDSRTSVVDPQCRAHGHQNLFVAGSSVFPTGGTANPTLTIAALALRCSLTIANQLS